MENFFFFSLCNDVASLPSCFSNTKLDLQGWNPSRFTCPGDETGLGVSPASMTAMLFTMPLSETCLI